VTSGLYGFSLFLILTAATAAAGTQELSQANQDSRAATYYHYLLGSIAESESDSTEALQEYTQALGTDPGNAEVHLARARVYMNQGRADEMKKEIDAILGKDPDHSEANELLGSYFYSQKEQDKEAVKKAREALEKAAAAPANPRVYFLLSQLYIEEDPENPETLKKALSAMETFCEAEPTNPEGHYRKGLIHQALKDDAAAERDFVTAVERAPTYTAAYRTLLGFYAQQNRLEDLKKLSRQILAENPLDLRTRAALAATLYEQGFYAEALEAMDFENLGDAYNSMARALAAKIYSRLNRPRTSIEILKEFEKEPQAPVDALLELAQAYEATGDFAAAERIFENLLEREELTERAPLLLHLGFSQQMQKKYADAEQTYTDGIAAAQKAGDRETEETLRRDRAMLLAEAGDVKKAEVEAEQTVRSFPDSLRARALKSEILWQTGKRSEAVQELKRLPAPLKDTWPARLLLARKLFELKDYRGVARTLEHSTKDPKSPQEAIYLEGAARERARDIKKAREIFEKGLQRFPDSTEMMNYLGYTLIDNNIDLDDAIELVRKAVSIEPENEAYLDSLAWGMYKKGRFEESRVSIDEALKFDASSWEILEHAGDIYYALGLKSEAAGLYDRALEAKPDDPGRIRRKRALCVEP